MFLFFIIIFLSLAVVLTTHILFAVTWLCAWPWHVVVPYKPFGWITLVLVVFIVAALLYGNIWGRFRYEVKSFDYNHRDIPASFEGYRIVHISDLHLDSWRGNVSELQGRFDAINALHPDLICFTGDLVSLSTSEAEPFTQALRSLHASDGIVSVLGNHDYFPYSHKLNAQQKETELQKLIAYEIDTLGWRLLLNEHLSIIRTKADGDTEYLNIIGCENQSMGARRVVQRDDLKKAMQGIKSETDAHSFQILLSHDPSHWRHGVLHTTSIPLTLSGHTHAMQCRIGGFTPSSWVYPECDGLYDEDGQSLYVNIGLGGTVPFRIGATPEITLITLKTIKP